jgi:hypothetical protein
MAESLKESFIKLQTTYRYFSFCETWTNASGIRQTHIESAWFARCDWHDRSRGAGWL